MMGFTRNVVYSVTIAVLVNLSLSGGNIDDCVVLNHPPICMGSPLDCVEHGLEYYEDVQDPKCFLGRRVRCCPEGVAKYGLNQACTWIGLSPVCTASPLDCAKLGNNYVKSDYKGDGKACGFGNKVYCCDPEVRAETTTNKVTTKTNAQVSNVRTRMGTDLYSERHVTSDYTSAATNSNTIDIERFAPKTTQEVFHFIPRWVPNASPAWTSREDSLEECLRLCSDEMMPCVFVRYHKADKLCYGYDSGSAMEWTDNTNNNWIVLSRG